MSIKEKRKKVTDFILAKVQLIDKHTSANNVERIKKELNTLSDTAFDKYMKNIRDGKACIYIYIPNLEKHPTFKDIFAIAKSVKVNLMQRLSIVDNTTKEKFLTPEEYFVVRLPIRRQEQYAEHNLALPKGDSDIDPLTGQVSKASDDRKAGITNPEIQSLIYKGLENTLKEIVSIRGGNIDAWQSGIKKNSEETGIVRLADIDKNSKNRTAVVGQAILESLHIENNLETGEEL